ncbi:hypothetical protein BKA65DRAFT_455485 [Rhexocercosporidium sp. MPI-PUGE-AT-0058]|nr:hypothetical protein BKA65DRAFT_455485 [Rhexocercosporidium sp. MPI-PUGE-AT-0058]
MTTVSSSTSWPPQADEPPYPSFGDLSGNRLPVRFSDATKRLFWPLDGDFPAAISVMKTAKDPDSLEPFFQPDPVGGSGMWHEISDLPLTEPKVSSVEASVEDLERWSSNWMEHHRGHVAQEIITYGEMSNDDRPYASEMNEDGSWDADSDTEYVLGCCGEDRPEDVDAKLVVHPSAGCDFVTIGDYVSAVHPWLMSLREDILFAKIPMASRPPPLPTELMVARGPHHDIKDREGWIQRTEGARMHGPITASTARLLDRIRQHRASEGLSNSGSLLEVANVQVA